MKKLVFKEVSILSKVEKAGRTETFDPTTNLLTGENDVGKSTLIKDLITHWVRTCPASKILLGRTRDRSTVCALISVGSNTWWSETRSISVSLTKMSN